MSFFSRRTQNTPDEEPTASDESQDHTNDAALPASAEPAQNNTSRNFDTALGAGSNLEGTLSSDGNVRLDGTFKGTLNISGNVLVGITAEIDADIVAQNISVAGVVRGDVKGKKVHLLATAKIWGNIEAAALITEDGALIDGRVTMGKPNDNPNLSDVTQDDLAGFGEES